MFFISCLFHVDTFHINIAKRKGGIHRNDQIRGWQFQFPLFFIVKIGIFCIYGRTSFHKTYGFVQGNIATFECPHHILFIVTETSLCAPPNVKLMDRQSKSIWNRSYDISPPTPNPPQKQSSPPPINAKHSILFLPPSPNELCHAINM